MSTTTDVATRRNGGSPAAVQPGAALELRAGQTMWTKDQHAALVAMGIPRQASSAELGVFLHQCQRTGLDPFSRQIYLIYRDTYDNGQKVSRPTTQVGIDGFRVIRDRIARRDGLRVEYEDTLWYGPDGQAYDVWLWDEPPAACKVTVVVDGRRFPGTLRFGEYAQRKKDGTLNKMWGEKPAHMIEKCCEADALRKAFPNDMAGVILEDAAPLAEDAPPQRPRVTADQARQRIQHVKSEVVPPEDAPWPGDAAPAQPEPEPGSQLVWRDGDPRNGVIAQLTRLGVTSTPGQVDCAVKVTGAALTSLEGMNHKQASDMTALLARCATVDDIEALITDGTVPGE